MIAAEYLDSIRESSGKICGEGVHEQIKSLVDRWKKVIRDSEGDDSSYRKQYANFHRQFTDTFSEIIKEQSGTLELYTESLDGARQAFEDAWNRIAVGDTAMAGTLDASAHILVELEKVLDV